MDKRSFGKQLKKLRESHGMTTAGFSAALGVNESEFISWENGEVLPSLEQAVMISDALGVPVDKLTAHRPLFKMKKSDDLSEEEKRTMIEAINEKSARDYRVGKKIVIAIIAVELVLTVLSCILTLDILSIVVTAIFLALLYKGKIWARYYYIYIAAMTALGVFMVMDVTSSWVELVAELIILALRLSGALLFAFSRPVKEFLYSQDAG